jgi:outer membrane autotransporter protein
MSFPMSTKQILTRFVLISFLLSCWLIPPAARGQMFWDPLVGGPNGSWDNVTLNWATNSLGGGQTSWLSGSDAVFSASDAAAVNDFTVTFTQNVSVGDLTYTGGNLGSTLLITSAVLNPLTMANPQMNVTADFGTTLFIAAPIGGAGNLTLQGGTLILTNANSYSGGTTINAGTLQLGDFGNTGSILGPVVNNDTLNIVNANLDGISSITNNSGGTTNFLNANDADTVLITNNGGTTNFKDTSNADRAFIVNNGGFTQFFDSATAGLALITSNDSGFTEFFDNSTAGHANIFVNSGGQTDFNNASMAGTATIQNRTGGFTNFNNTSTADHSTITNQGGTTAFFDTSTAGHASITSNDGGLAEFLNKSTAGNAVILTNTGGFTEFFDTSTAGQASITNTQGGETVTISPLDDAPIGNAGITEFFDTSTAGEASIINTQGGEVVAISPIGNAPIPTGNAGMTEFFDSSTAGKASILNIQGGETDFNNTSTASNATIVNNIGSFTKFFDTSTAGNAAITNNNGTTEFLAASTAGSATVTNISGGFTEFLVTSTAGNATISSNSNGGTLFSDTSTAGTAVLSSGTGGITAFLGSSTGANSTIIANPGGLTLFLETSTGGQARVITNAGGIFDMSNLSSTGMTAGSIEGAGKYFLGSKALTVGLNNLSTTVSGMIIDGESVSVGISPLARLEPSSTGGSLIKVGTGTLTLTGLNTYSGGTSFNGGVVAVNGDLNLGTGPLSFNGGTLEALTAGGGITSRKAITLNAAGGNFLADEETVSLLSAAIGGTGSLTKDGAGSLALTGTNTYAGGTTLNAGTLIVNGAQALGLGNVTVNGGVLRADPQQINVRGNYSQSAGGTLQLQVADANRGQYDSLNVGGNATLGGTLQLISIGFRPRSGDELALVTTGGVVFGRFGQFVDPFGPQAGFTISELVYGPNSVVLEFRTASSFALTVNQLAAASLIDSTHLDPRVANLISFLDSESVANLPGDFEKISPDGLTAFYEISFSNANIQRLNLEGRLDEIHNGVTGFSSNMKVNGATVNLEDRADADGKSSKSVVEPILRPAPENRWGVWVTGFGDFVSVDADGNAKGYNFTTGGVSLGIDFRITDQLAIGAMGDYSHTWTSLSPSGHIDVDSGRGGLYATWYQHGLYFNAAIYGGHNNYDTSRAGLGGLATGGTEGAEWSTFISGGYDFHFGAVTVGPIAALQYTDVGIDSFDEKGSLAPLNIHSDSAESLRSDVGFRVFYQWQIGKMVLEPSLKAAWEHEYKYSALPITAGFAGVPGPSATFFGPSEGHDSAVVSAGVSLLVTPAITTYLNYDGQLGRDNYDSNAVTGGVRISF